MPKSLKSGVTAASVPAHEIPPQTGQDGQKGIYRKKGTDTAFTLYINNLQVGIGAEVGGYRCRFENNHRNHATTLAHTTPKLYDVTAPDQEAVHVIQRNQIGHPPAEGEWCARTPRPERRAPRGIPMGRHEARRQRASAGRYQGASQQHRQLPQKASRATPYLPQGGWRCEGLAHRLAFNFGGEALA